MTILVTCDIWDTDYNFDHWEPEFMTFFVAWQLRGTLDSIRNSCDVLFNSFSQSQISLAVRHRKKLIQCEMYSIFWQLVFQWHDHDLKRKVWMYVLYTKPVSSSNQESEIMMLTLQSCDKESKMPHHEPKHTTLAQRARQICVGEIYVKKARQNTMSEQQSIK